MKSADSGPILPEQTLDRIVASVKENIPYAKSLVLIGSRADDRYSVSDANSDYDVVVVVSGWRVLSAIRASKRVRAQLASVSGAEITVNPVPIGKIRKPRGNYMVLKMLREGRTLSGTPITDYAGSISESDIDSSWHFFYLASQAKRLLDALAPLIATTSEPNADQLHSKAIYAAGKTIVACGEIRVLVEQSRYLSNPQDVEPALREIGVIELADRVSQAALWIDSDSSKGTSLEPWRMARETLVSTLHYLANAHCSISSIEDSAFQQRYLRSAGTGRVLKNLQFSALSLIKGDVVVRPVLSRSGVAERLKLALFHTLLATLDVGDFDLDSLSKAEQVMAPLDSSIGRDVSKNSRDRWLYLHRSVTRIYPRACVALGI